MQFEYIYNVRHNFKYCQVLEHNFNIAIPKDAVEAPKGEMNILTAHILLLVLAIWTVVHSIAHSLT